MTTHQPVPAPRPATRPTSASARLATAIARLRDGVLLTTLDQLTGADADRHPGDAETKGIAVAALLCELERRHPECEDAILAWVDSTETATQTALARASLAIYRDAGVG